MPITDENILQFIRGKKPSFDGFLGKLQKDCYNAGLPVIPPETAQLLKLLVLIHRPENILEIGCCVGFSASLFASVISGSGKVTTVDRYPVMCERARQNFHEQGFGEKIRLIESDGKMALNRLAEEGCLFDFVFIDAAKGQYIEFLKLSMPLLKKGGLIVFDNVLQDGDVVKNRSDIEKRQRTIHSRLNSLIDILCGTSGLETSLLPVGDGLAVCLKTENEVNFKYD